MASAGPQSFSQPPPGPGERLTTTCHTGLAPLQERAAAGLLPEPDLFASAAWLALTARHCAAPGAVRLIELRSDAGALWLPLMETGPGAWQALASWYSFRWAPLWEGAAGPQARARLLRAAARALRGRARRLTLAPLPDEAAQELTDALGAAGWRVERSLHHRNQWLTLEDHDFDAYWQRRPGALRETVRRKSKAVGTQIYDRFDADAWDRYTAVYAASWKPQEGQPAFLRALAEREGAAGRLRLGLAFHDGEAVAAQLWTLDHGTALIHKLAHREAARALSPGSVLTAAMMRQVIERDRVTAVDFGTGEDAYKRDWMEASRPRWRLDALDPRDPRAWPPLARRWAKRLVGRSPAP